MAKKAQGAKLVNPRAPRQWDRKPQCSECRERVTCSKTQSENMFSGLPRTADITERRQSIIAYPRFSKFMSYWLVTAGDVAAIALNLQ